MTRRVLLQLLRPVIGTKRHCTGWLTSCPESRELRTQIKGPWNRGASLPFTLRGTERTVMIPRAGNRAAAGWPAAFAKYIADETGKWADVAAKAGLVKPRTYFRDAATLRLRECDCRLVCTLMRFSLAKACRRIGAPQFCLRRTSSSGADHG